MTLPMLALGCSGIVSVAAHVVGDEMKEMVDAWFAGDTALATRRHLELFPVFKGVFVASNPVPIKTLLNMSGMKVGEVRLPLVRATEAEIQFLRNLWNEIVKIRAGARKGAKAKGKKEMAELRVASEENGDIVV